jgi:hypothetical protein
MEGILACAVIPVAPHASGLIQSLVLPIFGATGMW